MLAYLYSGWDFIYGYRALDVVEIRRRYWRSLWDFLGEANGRVWRALWWRSVPCLRVVRLWRPSFRVRAPRRMHAHQVMRREHRRASLGRRTKLRLA